MNRLTAFALSAALLLVMLAGCPDTPKPAGNTPVVDTSLAARNEICETLPTADSAAVAAIPNSTPAKPKPKPAPKSEPEPEPPPKPKALPRMWDYGSEKCIPCQEMLRILTPMEAEYQNKVDIRIINVYQEQQLASQARIQVIPTQVFYDSDGKELFRHVGVYPRDSIVAKFRELGWE